MKPKTSDHSYGSSESRVTGVDPFLQKLTTESLTTDLSGGSKIGTKLKSICSSLKDLPKSVGMLLIFHVLNTSVAVGGAVFGLLMLVSMALLAFAGLAVFVVRGMMSIPHKNLRYLGYVVLVLLCLLSALNTYTLIGTYAFFIAGAIGVGLFCLSVSIINWLASVDAKIADFIIPVISPNSTTDVNTQRPDGRASRVGIRGNCDRGFILPRFTKKYQAWTAILNFAILKSIAGALSAAVIVFAVILPFLALSSGGNDPVVDRWIKNPSADCPCS
ncbi:hypothetical protein BBO99_00000062 [Phytophthora kernoviae]|uniref:Uncharacterized protein n=2 Tax=Phytophthora kernoviae TaxID=325452 RepID=A0A3R7NN38_9STRA|nr:hypothetical protein G195_002082 [Phytophthora kernoviae 00238/432]KAG2533114.1 hypothetical protein JM16_000172 [Phytophthora kernoviae]KAG2533311.1 hypothetical protein JM18_000181 [Phytophthora kernoviae]RLN26851.1 hypothetical protein BBI17_000062 [Phytophthora kernoviae]RLN85942.1 hypothetical protein BBO99_00000062 [Phytophthora kernoviae]